MPEQGLSYISNSEFNTDIVFTPDKGYINKQKNISNTRLTGEMTSIHKIGKANIISSFFDSLNASNVRFYNSDIKDSRFTNSTFEKCNFNHSSHNNNWVRDTNFSNCTFSQTSITLSDFTNCSFINCDFSNVIISDCRFAKCVFSSCVTSNKMIESSLIFDCSFKTMDIEVEIILGNFGLSVDNVIDCSIWKMGEKNNKKSKSENSNTLVEDLLISEENSIQKFKLRYFLSPTIVTDVSDTMDTLFNVSDWLRLCRNPNRFKLQIEKLHEFLLYQFDSNNLRLRTLVQLFEISAQLSDAISKRTDLIDLQRTIDGVFLTLERIIEHYLTVAKILLAKSEQDNECRILVEGPLELDYYTNELADILEIAPVSFVKIIKHNSPNELFIHWEDIKDLWPVILFVFSTKFKVELYKIETETKSIKTRSQQITRGNEILTLESGFLDKTNDFAFRLKALLPGEKGLNLVMQISPERYKKLMKIVKDIIVFDKKEKQVL